MLIGIEPTVDYAFKRVFGRQENSDILCSLLNAVLQRPPGLRVESLEILNPFLPQEALDDKLAILDIKARDESGATFNVEMQVRLHHALQERVLYYWAKLFTGQLSEGDDYQKLQPTISVLVLDAKLFPALPGPHHRFRLRDDSGAEVFSNHIEMHVLELPKFEKSLDELADDLDKWLFFLRRAATLDVNQWPAQLADSPWNRAGKELTMLSQTDIEREQYESRRKGQLDYTTDMRAERRIGRVEGRAEGRAEGETYGEIRLIQRLLRVAVSSHAALEAMNQSDIAKLHQDLVAKAKLTGFDLDDLASD